MLRIAALPQVPEQLAWVRVEVSHVLVATELRVLLDLPIVVSFSTIDHFFVKSSESICFW